VVRLISMQMQTRTSVLRSRGHGYKLTVNQPLSPNPTRTARSCKLQPQPYILQVHNAVPRASRGVVTTLSEHWYK